MNARHSAWAAVITAATLSTAIAACDEAPEEPLPLRPRPAPAASAAAAGPSAAASSAAPAGDPYAGKTFTLEDATEGLAGDGPLYAHLKTDQGTLHCELYSDKAPITVANFVGLARGTRPFERRGQWVKQPAYDGTVFHRIIKGFMIQGGDPTGTGTGSPGYTIPDEMWEGARYDRRGVLCMANSGPNTGGMQFFILDGIAPHLASLRTYTVFGLCEPGSVIEKLASVEVRAVPGKFEKSKPVDPPELESVTITRGKNAKAAPAKAASGAASANPGKQPGASSRGR